MLSTNLAIHMAFAAQRSGDPWQANAAIRAMKSTGIDRPLSRRLEPDRVARAVLAELLDLPELRPTLYHHRATVRDVIAHTVQLLVEPD